MNKIFILIISLLLLFSVCFGDTVLKQCGICGIFGGNHTLFCPLNPFAIWIYPILILSFVFGLYIMWKNKGW